ncbi:MAG: hypothetical protein ACWA5R_08430 [bacterium]
MPIITGRQKDIQFSVNSHSASIAGDVVLHIDTGLGDPVFTQSMTSPAGWSCEHSIGKPFWDCSKSTLGGPGTEIFTLSIGCYCKIAEQSITIQSQISTISSELSQLNNNSSLNISF